MAASGASGLYVNPNTGAAQAGLAPFRNAIINGDMRINQRGTSTNLASLTAVATASPGSWVADRWNVYRNGFVAGGVMGQGTNLTTADLPFTDAGIKTFGRIGRLTSNTSTVPINLDYNMESQDCYKYIGKTVVLSFYYRTGANFSATALTAAVYTGTSVDQALRSTYTGAANTNANISTSANWTRYSFIANIPSSATQISIEFYYTPVGTAGANDYMDITGVQLELGSVATLFEVRPYSVELYSCKRYYVRFNSGFFAIGYAYGTGGAVICSVNFQNRMRISILTLETPAGSTNVLSTSLNAATGFIAQYQGSLANDYQLTAISLLQFTSESENILIYFAGSTAVTAGLGRSITIQTNYYIGFSAEI